MGGYTWEDAAHYNLPQTTNLSNAFPVYQAYFFGLDVSYKPALADKAEPCFTVNRTGLRHLKSLSSQLHPLHDCSGVPFICSVLCICSDMVTDKSPQH